MSYDTTPCDRCGSIILEQQHSHPQKMSFYRELPDGDYQSEEARLCSVCLDDLWECVFNKDIDRSDKADPKSVEKVKEGIKIHKEELEEVMEQLEEEK